MADPYERVRERLLETRRGIIKVAPREIIAEVGKETLQSDARWVVRYHQLRRFYNLQGFTEIACCYSAEVNRAGYWLTFIRTEDFHTETWRFRAIIPCKLKREAKEIAVWRWRELRKAQQGKPCKIQLRRHTP